MFSWDQSYNAHFGINYINNGLSKLNVTLNYINFDVIYAKKFIGLTPEFKMCISRSFRKKTILQISANFNFQKWSKLKEQVNAAQVDYPRNYSEK